MLQDFQTDFGPNRARSQQANPYQQSPMSAPTAAPTAPNPQAQGLGQALARPAQPPQATQPMFQQGPPLAPGGMPGTPMPPQGPGGNHHQNVLNMAYQQWLGRTPGDGELAQHLGANPTFGEVQHALYNIQNSPEAQLYKKASRGQMQAGAAQGAAPAGPFQGNGMPSPGWGQGGGAGAPAPSAPPAGPQPQMHGNPFQIIQQYQGSHDLKDPAALQGLLQALQQGGVNASLATHAGGQPSADKINFGGHTWDMIRDVGGPNQAWQIMNSDPTAPQAPSGSPLTQYAMSQGALPQGADSSYGDKLIQQLLQQIGLQGAMR